MRKIFFFILTIVSIAGNAQVLSKQDSINILFKSKLLTTSEYGITGKLEILKDIDTQKATFLNTFYKNFVFIKIDFSQKYFRLNQDTSTLIRPCSYYLAFSVKDSRFFKLGGFNSTDIEGFFKYLEWREDKIFNGISGNEVEGVDIYCLQEFSELSVKKKCKNKSLCFENCDDVTKLQTNTN